jgi:hypothetical protein
VHTDHLNTPRKIAQPTSGTLAWRWDIDPFSTAAPNQNPAGLGTFAYNLCGFHACRPVIPADAGPSFHTMPGRV